MSGVERALAARGYALLREPVASALPRETGLLGAVAADRRGAHVFVKVAPRPRLGRGVLHRSHRLLGWLAGALPPDAAIRFPRPVECFASGRLTFLVQEYVEHDREHWRGRHAHELFLELADAIASLQRIRGFPRFVERWDWKTLSRVLARHAANVAKRSRAVPPGLPDRIVARLRSRRELYEAHAGVLSHGDLHAENVLATPDGPTRFCLVDVESCRVASRFADYARCANRAALRCAREHHGRSGEVRHLDSGALGALEKAVLERVEDAGPEASAGFALMLLVDELIYLSFVLTHQPDPRVRDFTDRFCAERLVRRSETW